MKSRICVKIIGGSFAEHTYLELSVVRATLVNSSVGEGSRAYIKVVSICIFCLIFTTQTNVSLI